MRKGFKKSAASLLLAAAVIVSVPAVVSANSADVTVKVNGAALSATAVHYNGGKIYVDLKSFSTATGISYTYDSKTQKATVNGKDIKVVVTGGVPAAYIKDLVSVSGANSLTWDGKTHTAQVNFASKLLVYGDTVSSNAGCVLQNRFTVGDAIVFRMKAINPITGQIAADAKLQLHLSTGDVLDMTLGTHPPGAPNAEQFWTAKYTVTDKTPKGTLNYYVTASTATMKGQYQPFNVMPSLVTIVAPESNAPAATEPADSAPASEAAPAK
ncbi:hypothetical protein GZH47_26640 [Paenibacillus rhizovicinus]|uniref:Copper amine oxidase N-terminal domain-containing protein n=1 Tax=Paenibacillus rhizovicinus TaxID=2704463 RepID=A0A6C0P684_9BACL|nr:hypothetical protein [Paenibacillus rhizovicinus]QHW34017.1 hypothetical protein GZH47_26640 [Paenibacillus rhizovicinus]